METHSFVNWGGVLIIPVLLILIALGIVLARRSRVGFFSGRRPKPRHIVIRIICGALGAAILVAVAIGTICEVKGVYKTVEAVATQTVKVPTKPALLPDVPFKPGEYELTRETRILVTIVAMESPAVDSQALAAKSFEVRWPQDKGKAFARSFWAGETRVEASINIWKVTAYRDAKDGPEKIGRFDGSWTLLRVSPTSNQGCSGSGSWQAAWRVVGAFGSASRWNAEGSALSVVPIVSYEPDMALYAFSTPLAADDPLKEATLAELVASHSFQTARTLAGAAEARSGGVSWGSHMDYSIPMRGFALVAHIGVSSLLLLLAAILLTQVFTHRALILPAMLAGVILYAAALDRTALGMNLARLDDAKAPAAVRCVACVQTAGTFFYGKTALDHIGAVAKDEATPKELKALADEAANRLWGRVKNPLGVSRQQL